MARTIIALLVVVAIVLVLLKVAVAGGILGLIAIGAILYFATNLHVAHVSIDTVGLILMIAGLAGLVLGFVQQGIWSRRARRDVVVEDRRDPRQPPY
jgi:hypothetical protein